MEPCMNSLFAEGCSHSRLGLSRALLSPRSLSSPMAGSSGRTQQTRRRSWRNDIYPLPATPPLPGKREAEPPHQGRCVRWGETTYEYVEAFEDEPEEPASDNHESDGSDFPSFTGPQEDVQLDFSLCSELSGSDGSFQSNGSGSCSEMPAWVQRCGAPGASLSDSLSTAVTEQDSQDEGLEADRDDDEEEDVTTVQESLCRFVKVAEQRRCRRSVASCRGSVEPTLALNSSLWQKRKPRANQ